VRHERVNDKRSGIRGTEGWRGAAYVTPRRVPSSFVSDPRRVAPLRGSCLRRVMRRKGSVGKETAWREKGTERHETRSLRSLRVSLSWPFRPFGPGTGPGEWRVSLRSSLTRPCLPPPRRETRRPPAPTHGLRPSLHSAVFLTTFANRRRWARLVVTPYGRSSHRRLRRA